MDLSSLTAQEAGALGLVAGMGVTAIIVGTVLCVLTVIAMWKIFTKAGEAGWKSIIPVYSLYILCKVAYKTSMFWAWLGLAAVIGIASAIGGTVGTILTVLCYIALAVIAIMLMIHLGKRFGKSGGFIAGLILLNTIFILILGFGSSDYDISRDPA